MTSLPTAHRDPWLDALRGFAIVLVVLGHTLRGLEAAGIASSGFLDVRLYAVHVQILFFVSGILVVGTLGRQDVGRFAVSRFTDLLLPMILWTYIFLGAKLIAGPYQNSPVDARILLTPPIPGQLHLWFLWALFLMQGCVALAWKLAPDHRRGPVFLALTIGSLGATFVALPRDVVYWIGGFIDYFPFFLTGLLISLYRLRYRPTLATGLLGAALFATAFIGAPQIAWLTGGFLPVSMAACIGAYLAAGLMTRFAGLTRALAYLGVGSMAIYVLHTIFSAGLREVLVLGGVTSPGIHLVLGVLAGIVLPLLVRRVARKARVNRLLAL